MRDAPPTICGRRGIPHIRATCGVGAAGKAQVGRALWHVWEAQLGVHAWSPKPRGAPPKLTSIPYQRCEIPENETRHYQYHQIH